MPQKKRKNTAPDEHVAVRILESLRHDAKVYAAKTKRDLQEVLDDAVREYLKNHPA